MGNVDNELTLSHTTGHASLDARHSRYVSSMLSFSNGVEIIEAAWRGNFRRSGVVRVQKPFAV